MDSTLNKRLLPINQTDLPLSGEKIEILKRAMKSSPGCEADEMFKDREKLRKEARIKALDLAGDDENSISNVTAKYFFRNCMIRKDDSASCIFYNNADKYARANSQEWTALKEAVRGSIMENKGDLLHASKIIEEELAKTGQSPWTVRALFRLARDKRSNNASIQRG